MREEVPALEDNEAVLEKEQPTKGLISNYQ
jgi:hypothetical protein